MYLAALGLSCDMQDVLVEAHRIFSCDVQTLSCSTWGSSSLTRDGARPHWEHGVSTTGPPGKSQSNVYLTSKPMLFLLPNILFKRDLMSTLK